MRIVVLSTFDVWPPKDGGQSRYVGIWSSFPARHDVQILAYDFRNLAARRRYRLDDTVEVVVPPADARDARCFSSMMERTGLWLHDVLCLREYVFSDEFLACLRHAVRDCDVIVASHPYLAQLAFPMARPDAIKVYESHNVEFDIKARYFETGRDRGILDRLLTDVRFGEAWAAQQSDVVTAVSREDADRLSELYGLAPHRIHIAPNGSHVPDRDLLSPAQRNEMRRALNIPEGKGVGIFLGSAFQANVSSYVRLRAMLAECGFDGAVLLVGSIGDADRTTWPAVDFEERWFGFVDQELRDVLLSTADFALQMIFSGAGTNLKLFDYMGAGVPIIANAFGRRGVEGDGWYWPAEASQELARAISEIRDCDPSNAERTRQARSLAKRSFDWKSISSALEERLQRQ